MKNKNYLKLIPLSLGVIVLSLSLAYLLHAAWTEPGTAPPGDNVPAPLNVGTVTQTKQGGLNIMSNVGIGTTAPARLLEVRGNHNTAQIRLFSDQNNQGIGGVNTANLNFWASEPGVTWQGTGIGGNVTWQNQGGWGPRVVNTTKAGSFIRFLDGTTHFGIANTANIVTNSMTIAATGNVGIGTTAPASALQVEGYIQFDTRTGMPPATDCNHATERGRTIVDSAAKALWMCMDIGWVNMRVTMHYLAVGITGQGTVTSSPPGISCPGDCIETYAHGTSVTLTATPASGWVFGGWGGACTGTGDCIVSMTEARTVQATFQEQPPSAYFLFNTAEGSNGHLGAQGGRAGADAMCAADPHRPAVCTTYAWAFISVSGTDEIRDFPTTIPGRSGIDWNSAANWYFRDGTHAGVLADTSFSGLLDGSVENEANAGGMHGSYRTGATGGGALGSRSCNGFTSGSIHASVLGYWGSPHLTDGRWLHSGKPNCAALLPVLCACF